MNHQPVESPQQSVCFCTLMCVCRWNRFYPNTILCCFNPNVCVLKVAQWWPCRHVSLDRSFFMPEKTQLRPFSWFHHHCLMFFVGLCPYVSWFHHRFIYVFCWVMPICFMVSSPFHLCFCWVIMLIGGFKHLLFSISYGMSSFPLTNSIIVQDG